MKASADATDMVKSILKEFTFFILIILIAGDIYRGESDSSSIYYKHLLTFCYGLFLNTSTQRRSVLYNIFMTMTL